MNHKYQFNEGRKIFRLREPELHPQKDFKPNVKTPPRYKLLNDEEKLHIAEFIDFLKANREGVEANDDLHFYIRDHENRPMTTELPTPEDKPKDYDKLSDKEKAHVFEFISFLLTRRETE